MEIQDLCRLSFYLRVHILSRVLSVEEHSLMLIVEIYIDSIAAHACNAENNSYNCQNSAFCQALIKLDDFKFCKFCLELQTSQSRILQFSNFCLISSNLLPKHG